MNPLVTLAIICGLIAIVPAVLLEMRRRRRALGALQYAWGYFQGITGFLFGIACLVLWASVGAKGFTGPLLFIAFAVPGWLVIKRNRWAYIILTFVSLNPILWIANGVYIRNRWKELEGRVQLPPPSNAVEERNSADSAKRLSGLERLAKLRDDGLLTEEEFQEQKRKLIAS